MLKLKQPDLFINAARISGQAAVCADDPMTRNNDGNFIVSDRTAHSLRRHPGKSPLFGKLPRYIAVSHGLTVRNLQKYLPYVLTEPRANRVKRRREIGFPAVKVDIKPTSDFREDRSFICACFSGRLSA